MRITKLEFQKKDPNRVSVYVDEKFAVGLDSNDLISLGLYSGQEITPEQLSKIIFQGEAGKLYNASLNYLSFRPRSENETRQFLYRKTHKSIRKKPGDSSDRKVEKIDTEELAKIIDNVVDRLYEKKYLDDEKFAQWFLEQRTTFKPKGKIALKFELARKGVGRKVVDSVLNNVSKASEEAMAEEALQKKISRSHKISEDPRVLKQKLIQFLVSRGFGWDLASEAVAKIVKKEYT